VDDAPIEAGAPTEAEAAPAKPKRTRKTAAATAQPADDAADAAADIHVEPAVEEVSP
jgi:hypothetical protein